MARAIQRVRADQAGFFALLSDGSDEDAVDRICDRFDWSRSDAYALLDQPLRVVLPAHHRQ